METFGHSHTGWVRENNEDRFLVRELRPATVLLAVADGVGGEAGGEVAARIVTDTLAAHRFTQPYDAAQLSLLIQEANQAILKEAEKNRAVRYMGTTATVALLDGNTVHWAHAGDSRLYHFQAHRLTQVTIDHNMAQQLVRLGKMTPEQARLSPMRNFLLQYVGTVDCQPDAGTFDVRPDDLLLLCTDGLFGALPHAKITSLVAARTTIKNIARSLVLKSLLAGGRDNVTVVLARV